jgi:hypothetical protein
MRGTLASCDMEIARPVPEDCRWRHGYCSGRGRVIGFGIDTVAHYLRRIDFRRVSILPILPRPTGCDNGEPQGLSRLRATSARYTIHDQQTLNRHKGGSQS